nr:hypothetical protein [Treponemataceae bacterium]
TPPGPPARAYRSLPPWAPRARPRPTELGGGNGNDTGSGNTSDTADGIDYTNQPNGTLTIRNNTEKDMVLFEGETPTKDTILGGVRAGSSRAFDVSGKNDFVVGGWMIIKGMAASEYAANKESLTKAKVEYSAMATYHAGEYYEATINAAYTGDYCIKVSNNGKIGIELHKDSFNGEKIAYLPPYRSNQPIYFDDNKSIRLYPVYVYYSTRNHTVSTLSGDFFESRTVVPASVTESYMQTYSFPADPNTTWSQIMENISFPTAYITVTNGVEEGAYFKIGSAQYVAQNGQDAVGGVPVTFEVVSTKDGEEKQITLALYNGNVSVPVLTAGGGIPTIQNGYDYSVSLTKVAQGNTPAILANPNSYKAVISGGTPRDIKSEIETLPQQ